MRTSWVRGMLALGIGCLAAATVVAGEGGLRYTITVSKFENRAGWRGQWDIGDAWGAVLTDQLVQSGRFIVLGEQDMRNEALAEQDFGASGRTAGGKLTPVVGQMTPAQLLVKGEITHVQSSTTGGGGGVRIKNIRLGGSKDKAEVSATIYVVESTTGQVLASKSVTGKAARKGAAIGYSGADFGAGFDAFKKDNVGAAVEAAVGEAVDFLTAQLPSIPWSGSVVLVRDGQVWVNRGTREGVASGDTFVVGRSEIVRDPDTGEVLDESVEEVARIRVATVKEKLAQCDVLSGSLDAVEKGMTVLPAR